MLEMVGLVAGQHHRQQKFPTKKNQRCEDWNGREEQKESLGAEEDSVRGDGDVQCEGGERRW